MSLEPRQSAHCLNTLKVEKGQSLDIGILNGNLGQAVVSNILEDNSAKSVQIEVKVKALTTEPPKASNLIIYLALARPKMLRRMLRTVAELGIKKLYLINSEKVEKSFWQTASLAQTKIEQYFIEGLEQSKDTILPCCEIRKRFRPFVEDELSDLIQDQQAWVAHPYADQFAVTQLTNTQSRQHPLHLFIGPEGGFNHFEIELLNSFGVKAFNAGNRILRCETFLPWVHGVLSTGLNQTH